MQFLLMNVILCLTLILLLWIRRRRKLFSVFRDHGIQGPKPNFWTGNLNDFLKKREKCLTEYREKYGNVFGCFFGAKPFLVVSDPELIKVIQVKAFRSFSNRDLVLPDAGVSHSDISLSFIARKDEEWKVLRSIVSTSFTSGKLRKVVPLINDGINVLLEKISKKSRRNESFDIFCMLRNLTMDVTTKAQFGINTGVQNNQSSLFCKSASLLLNTDSGNVLAALSICFPELEPIPTKLRHLIDVISYTLGLRSVKFVFTSMEKIIRQRKERNQKRDDILQSLIDAKFDAAELPPIQASDLTTTLDNQQKEEVQDNEDTKNKKYLMLSEQSIRSNAVIFFIAGFEATSVTVSFAINYLAKHQDIQEKVRSEINSTIKRDSIQYDEVMNLHYLDQVISETLRIRPLNMLAITRIAKETFKYKGITIPKGISISIPTSLLHGNPDHWIDPESFNPDRFSPENKAKIDLTMYQPFGNGPRSCIGMRFAQLMIKLIIARILLSYKLQKAVEQEMDFEFSLFMNHPKEILIKATPIYEE